MRYVAAYLLCTLGGKTSPDAAAVKKVLESVGVEVEDDKLNKVISELKGKDINEVIAAGSEKLASVPSGGAVASSGGGGGGAADAAAPAEEKKEAKKEESEDESDDDMGFGLFD